MLALLFPSYWGFFPLAKARWTPLQVQTPPTHTHTMSQGMWNGDCGDLGLDSSKWSTSSRVASSEALIALPEVNLFVSVC